MERALLGFKDQAREHRLVKTREHFKSSSQKHSKDADATQEQAEKALQALEIVRAEKEDIEQRLEAAETRAEHLNDSGEADPEVLEAILHEVESMEFERDQVEKRLEEAEAHAADLEAT